MRPVQRRRAGLALGVLVLLVAGLVVGLRLQGGSSPSGPSEPCTGTASTCAAWGGASHVDGEISRAEVRARMASWLGDRKLTYGGVRSPGPGGWGSFRRDCSGFVSMALHLDGDVDSGGPTTVDLLSLVTPVAAADLRPGDLVGVLGPGTGGQAGHVQIFVKWVGSGRHQIRVAELGGLDDPPDYPHVITYHWPESLVSGAVLQPYRYNRIED
jgi:hypothetical protein